MSQQIYCPSCDRYVTPKKKTPWGAIVVILIFLGWFYGIGLLVAYLVYRGASVVCPICGYEWLKRELLNVRKGERTPTSHQSNKKEKATSWENSLKSNQGEEDSQTKKDLSVIELKEIKTIIENSDPRILDVLSKEVNARIIDENYRHGFLIGLNRLIQDKTQENRKLQRRKRHSTI